MYQAKNRHTVHGFDSPPFGKPRREQLRDTGLAIPLLFVPNDPVVVWHNDIEHLFYKGAAGEIFPVGEIVRNGVKFDDVLRK